MQRVASHKSVRTTILSAKATLSKYHSDSLTMMAMQCNDPICATPHGYLTYIMVLICKNKLGIP